MLEYWRRVTSFDTKCLTEICSYPWMSVDREKLSVPFVIICVNRIGDGLRSLTIREIAFWTDNIHSIGEGCPNIETMNFVFEDNYLFSEDEYPTLDIHFDLFSRLKTITVNRGYIIEVSAWVFLSIPTSIEVIRGLELNREEPFENGARMEGFFANRPSLRDICLGHLNIRDWSRKADIFCVIVERCPNLKSITLSGCPKDRIDYSGVVALESMKELCIEFGGAEFDDMEIVTICERSPLVEALLLQLRFSASVDLQSAALNALGALTKLSDLYLEIDCENVHVVAPSLVTEFVRNIARNSGASLRRLGLDYKMHLPTAAIEALANGCPKLRHVQFNVRVGEATPASIRFLIDCIVAHPSWIHQTGEWTLRISIGVMPFSGDEAEADRAAFKALAGPAANLPAGVRLNIY